MNISMIRWVFVILCAAILSGCVNNGRFVQGPDGKSYYELPKARNYEEHCNGAGTFSKKIASWRSHIEFREGKQFIIPHSKESIRESLDEDLNGVATFTEEGKRNYDKILELFERITAQEFADNTPEQVGQIIRDECMQKTVQGTWFKSSPKL